MVFDRDWFLQHQTKLLWLVNFPLTRRWFRWVLRIRPGDPGFRGIICEVSPDNYKVVRGFKDGELELSADFRTHPKFAKRLYYAFRPLWWMIHLWDQVGW